MRSFIRNSLIFFALGVVATVAVFYLINKDRLIPNDFHGLTPAESTVEEVVVEAKQVQETLQRVPDAGIPLATMKLSETQKTTLEKVGIDTQSFVITKDMVACSVEKLGAGRTEALIGGDAPSLLEITTLTPCLKSN